MFTRPGDYEKNEYLLFKLIFTTYNEEMMDDHQLDTWQEFDKCLLTDRELLHQWELIDRVIRRDCVDKDTRRKFLDLDVINQIWWGAKGFYHSQEMKDFIKYLKKTNKTIQKGYMKHFQGFCDVNKLNFN